MELQSIQTQPKLQINNIVICRECKGNINTNYDDVVIFHHWFFHKRCWNELMKSIDNTERVY